MRIAFMSYRSKPHCGGQGVYLRHLSRELVALGHHVEVYSGQPYPELDEGVILHKVPSLDLYREPDPFRVPKPKEFRDLHRRRGIPDDVHRRIPRAQDVQQARRAADEGPRRRLRHRPRQPDGRLGHARHRRPGLPADHHDPSPDHVRSPHRPGAGAASQEAQHPSLVRLPAHAEARRQAAHQDPHGLGVEPPRHHRRLRRRPLGARGHHPRRGRRVRTADRSARAGPTSSPWPAPTPR